MKYTYSVNLGKMEEVYFGHTKTDFFADDQQREKFNAELIVEADNEEEAERMRMGITDIRMWDLKRTAD
jgi:hypothetical protein